MLSAVSTCCVQLMCDGRLLSIVCNWRNGTSSAHFSMADLAAQCQGESKTNMPESISSSRGLQDAKEVIRSARK